MTVAHDPMMIVIGGSFKMLDRPLANTQMCEESRVLR